MSIIRVFLYAAPVIISIRENKRFAPSILPPAGECFGVTGRDIIFRFHFH